MESNTCTAFKRILCPGSTDSGRLFVTVKFDGRRLSITGVEGPLSNGDARGSCGQCVDALRRLTSYSPGWTPELAAQLADLWDRWHLNDMRPSCEHQRALGWDHARKVELVTYGLTSEAYALRNASVAKAAQAAAQGVPAALTSTERALVLLSDWFKDKHAPVDADSPLSGCYEVKKREQKAIGWIRPDEHPEGLLGRPCPTCSYKYGHAWQLELVPLDVTRVLQELPEGPSELIPPCWARD